MADSTRFVCLAGVILAAAIWDWRTGRVPNWFTLGAILGGLVLTGVIGMVRVWHGENWAVMGEEYAAAGLGLLVGFVPMAVIFFSGGMGGADVKVMTAVGVISANWAVAAETFFNAFVIAAILGIYLMIRHRLIKRTIQRIFGALLFAFARSRPEFTSDSPQVPFLVAVAAGGILAGGRHFLGWPIPWGFGI